MQALVAVLLLAPLTSVLVGPPPTPFTSSGQAQLTQLYLPLLLVNAAFVAYVSRLGLGRSIFWQLFGQRFREPGQVLADVSWGLALAGALLAFDAMLQYLAGWPESLASHALLPQTTGAKLCWLGLASLIGLGEELVYRGYLQQQFTALTGSVAGGIVVQSLLFGIAHGEQGPLTVVRFTGFALALGCMARQRRGLLGVVACHCALDLYAGLAG